MLGGADGQTLFIAAAEWDGDAGMVSPETGQLLAARAPAPHDGRPLTPYCRARDGEAGFAP